MSYILPAIQRLPFNLHFGEGQDESYQAINMSKADFESNKLGLAAGALYFDDVANLVVQSVRARSALVAGGLVISWIGDAARTGNISAYTAPTATTNDTFVANDLIGGYAEIITGTGVNQVRRILANTGGANATFSVAKKDTMIPGGTAANSPNIWGTAPDGTSTYQAFCPWEVSASGAVANQVRGVSLGVVTDGNYTLVAVKGVVQVLSVGTVDALIAGEVIVPSATAGTAKGRLTAGITAADAAAKFGYALAAYAGASAVRLCVIDTLANVPLGGNRPPL